MTRILRRQKPHATDIIPLSTNFLRIHSSVRRNQVFLDHLVRRYSLTLKAFIRPQTQLLKFI